MIAILLYIVFAAIWSAIFGKPEQDDIAGQLGSLWTQYLLIAVVAPVAEEVCFRGFLFAGLRNRAPFIVAAVGASLFFGLLHFDTGPSAVPQLVVFGVILALLYERTRSLWPPIFFHALNNAIALTFITFSL